MTSVISLLIASVSGSRSMNKKPSPVNALAHWDRQYLWHPFTQMQEWEQIGRAHV